MMWLVRWELLESCHCLELLRPARILWACLPRAGNVRNFCGSSRALCSRRGFITTVGRIYDSFEVFRACWEVLGIAGIVGTVLGLLGNVIVLDCLGTPGKCLGLLESIRICWELLGSVGNCCELVGSAGIVRNCRDC